MEKTISLLTLQLLHNFTINTSKHLLPLFYSCATGMYFCLSVSPLWHSVCFINLSLFQTLLALSTFTVPLQCCAVITCLLMSFCLIVFPHIFYRPPFSCSFPLHSVFLFFILPCILSCLSYDCLFWSLYIPLSLSLSLNPFSFSNSDHFTFSRPFPAHFLLLPTLFHLPLPLIPREKNFITQETSLNYGSCMQDI